MNGIAVPHASVKALVISLVAAAILLFALVGTAGAASPIGKDGTIHACYRVKGKPKGSLRIVPPTQRKCKRGERKVVWYAAGQPGANGQAGTSGGTGQAGQNGSNGASSSNEATLKTEVTSLQAKIVGLEEVLKGVTNGDLVGSMSTLNGLDNSDLLGAVDAVKGLTNTELTETVSSLPEIETLCTQNEELTKQINLISGAVKGLGLSSGLEALGLLKIPTLPTDLPVTSCVTP